MTASLRERALRLLARSEQTRTGLARKLARHASEDEIEALLAQLEASGLLSDARYVDSFLSSRAGRYGIARIRQDLRARGVEPALIAERLTPDPEQDFQLAHTLWARKFGTPPTDPRDYARQARFLLARGFGAEVVCKILKHSDE